MAKTLQIWIFPEKQDVAPRYVQKAFDFRSKINNFVQIVTPHDQNDGQALWIFQQAFLSLGIFTTGQNIEYEVQISGNGVYVLLLEGQLKIDGSSIVRRDAIGITDSEKMIFEIIDGVKILAIEVPMKI